MFLLMRRRIGLEKWLPARGAVPDDPTARAALLAQLNQPTSIFEYVAVEVPD